MEMRLEMRVMRSRGEVSAAFVELGVKGQFAETVGVWPTVQKAMLYKVGNIQGRQSPSLSLTSSCPRQCHTT